MNLTLLRNYIGLAGVNQSESLSARRVGNTFEWLMLCIAFWLPIQWYQESQLLLSHEILSILNWSIWSAFIIEAVVMTALVKRKWFYLWSNWINFIIIIVAFPYFWQHFPYIASLRFIRIFLIFRLVVPWVDISRDFLSRNNLGTTLLISIIVTTLLGILMGSFDTGISGPGEGVWWAWETVTTVGYGDVVPHTTEGKILAIIVMILGMGLFSLLTANFSAFLIGRGEKRRKQSEREVIELVRDMHQKVRDLESKLDSITNNSNQDKS